MVGLGLAGMGWGRVGEERGLILQLLTIAAFAMDMTMLPVRIVLMR